MSAVMGTEIRRVMRATAASISSRLMRSPSGYPRLKAIPALVVARAGNPASTKMRALPASQALGRTSIGPSTWSRRSASAFLPSSDVRACCMGAYLIASPSGVKAFASRPGRAANCLRFSAGQTPRRRRALERGPRSRPRHRLREVGAQAPITTRLLGGHLAGIRHYQGNEFVLNQRFPTVTAGLAIFETDPLVAPPGTRFSYSSYGFNLISAVVEGASGEQFLAYMSRHVFQPLKMTRTAPDRNDSLIPNPTRFYQRTESGQFVLAPSVDNSYKWAGGGF